jgi:tetratricopeptide (TPR) repeat protein
MKKLIVASSCGLAALLSCGDPAEQITTKIKEERIPVEITGGDLFKGNKILAYLDNETKFLKEANELFLQGLNAYRNQSDLDSANYYLRQSILKEPTPRAYFELGNVSLDKKDYNTALKAYGVAEQLDYQPVSKILYNKACLYSLKGEQEMAGQYLEYALQAGYNNLDHINKDADLEDLRGNALLQEGRRKGIKRYVQCG